jgi:uncharacterized protein (DUF1501 family)
MKRRDFVKNTSLGAIGVPFVLNGMEMNTVMKKLFSYSRNAEDRVLILIRLNGGNDGLNTVIPYDFYDNLVIQRPNIIIPQNQIVNLNTHYLGLHPAMAGMANMFGEGKLSIIQNVGYPDQNRSQLWPSPPLPTADQRARCTARQRRPVPHHALAPHGREHG